MMRKRAAALAAAAFMAVSMLAGCGTDGDTDISAEAETAAAAVEMPWDAEITEVWYTVHCGGDGYTAHYAWEATDGSGAYTDGVNILDTDISSDGMSSSALAAFYGPGEYCLSVEVTDGDGNIRQAKQWDVTVTREEG